MMSGVMEMIARCGVSLWLVPALAWTGVCFGDPVAWVMADLFLIPAFLWLYKHLKKEQVRYVFFDVLKICIKKYSAKG